MLTRRAWAALACCTLMAACVYVFDNPVGTLQPGQLTGTIVLQGAAPGQTLNGGVVKLAWSGLSVPLQPSGFFGFLDLPNGTYNFVYQIPSALDGGPPFVGVLRDVVIPAVSGGADAVDLGEVQVFPNGTVTGTVTGSPDPVVVAVLHVLDGGEEILESQLFSTTTTDGGSFQLAVPVGDYDSRRLDGDPLGQPAVQRHLAAASGSASAHAGAFRGRRRLGRDRQPDFRWPRSRRLRVQ